MVDPKKKGKYIGMVGALLVHVAFILLLILVGFALPEQQDEDGMPVMLGEVPNAFGSADPSLVKVDVMPETVAPKVQETVEQEMLTQEDEETVVIKPKAEPKKEEVKKKPEKPEKTEAEKAEEARKLAEAKAERERREAEEAARKRVAGAFGKCAGSRKNSRAESGSEKRADIGGTTGRTKNRYCRKTNAAKKRRKDTESTGPDRKTAEGDSTEGAARARAGTGCAEKKHSGTVFRKDRISSGKTAESCQPSAADSFPAVGTSVPSA